MYKNKKNRNIRKDARNILSITAAVGLTIIFAGVGVRIFGESNKIKENDKSFFASSELDKYMAGFGKEVLGAEAEDIKDKIGNTQAGDLKDKTGQQGSVNTEVKQENSSKNTGNEGQENSSKNTGNEGQESSNGNTGNLGQGNSNGNAGNLGQETSNGNTGSMKQESPNGNAGSMGQESSNGNKGNTEIVNQTDSPTPETSPAGINQDNQNTTSNTAYAFTDAPEGYFEDALFIGDSRTVDLEEYGNLGGADFFAVVGMSVYNITKQRVDTAGEKNIDIETLLSNHSYGKIYFMLGLNELGYDRQKTVEKYRAWIEYIRQMQPQAIIFIEANLHITAEQSAGNEEINNEGIDEFNNYTKELADNKDIFYIDVNELFDNEGGSLRSDLTHDGVHIFAKYYADWGEWLKKKAVVR